MLPQAQWDKAKKGHGVNLLVSTNLYFILNSCFTRGRCEVRSAEMGRGRGCREAAARAWGPWPPAQPLRWLHSLVLCQCWGQASAALPRAVMCSCASPSGLCMAQRHRGLPFAEASPSLTMHSLQNMRLHKLHFPYLSSVSSDWSFCHVTFMFGPPAAAERFSDISPCLFTANHIMLPTPIFSIPTHVSPPPCETVPWILSFLLYRSAAALASLCLTVPELFPCIVLFLVSLFIYHEFAFWFWDWVLLNSPVFTSDCSSVYAFL